MKSPVMDIQVLDDISLNTSVDSNPLITINHQLARSYLPPYSSYSKILYYCYKKICVVQILISSLITQVEK